MKPQNVAIITKVKSVQPDFFVDTKGHCFLCLSSPTSSSSSVPSPITTSAPTASTTAVHSFQYFSHYLRISKRAAFNPNVPIPPDLLQKVERSKLKVSLCPGCGAQLNRFSDLFRKWERIRLELSSCLEGIHRQMVRAKGEGKEKEFRKLGEQQSKDREKINIAQRVRRETLVKCSRKLRSTFPRVRVKLPVPRPKLSSKKVIKDAVTVAATTTTNKPASSSSQKQNPVKNKTVIITLSDSEEDSQSAPAPPPQPQRVLRRLAPAPAPVSPDLGLGIMDDQEPADISQFLQMEMGEPADNYNDVGRLTYSAAADASLTSTYPTVDSNDIGSVLRQYLLSSSTSESPHQNVIQLGRIGSSPTSNMNIFVPPPTTTSTAAVTATWTPIPMAVAVAPPPPQAPPAPAHLRPQQQQQHNQIFILKRTMATEPQPQSSSSSTTKPSKSSIRFFCNLCYKLFNSKTNLQRHHQSVHLHRRYPCDLCTNSYTQMSRLNQHKRQMHSIDSTAQALQQPKETIVTKTPTTTSNASMSNSNSSRVSCNICNKLFSSGGCLRRHYKSLHLNQRYQCNYCSKSYTQPGFLKTHMDAAHLGIHKPKPVYHFKCGRCHVRYCRRESLRRHCKRNVGCGGANVIRILIPRMLAAGGGAEEEEYLIQQDGEEGAGMKMEETEFEVDLNADPLAGV